MSVRYTADLEAIQTHVERARDFETAIEQTLTHLDQVVDRLHLTWIGQAADAHRRAHQEWTRGAAEMRRALAGLRAAALLAHDNYRSAADTNRRMWGPLA